MTRRYFGTDGIRGRVGMAPMTVDFAVRLASAAARVLAPNGGAVLIGKDTRLSGYLFESALEAGFVAAGVDVYLTGPLPTPGVAFMAQRFGCNFGVVISASHNLFEDNGIKFFDAAGGKLSDVLEAQIEQLIDEPPVTVSSQRLGRALRVDRSRAHYQEFCIGTLPIGVDLKGLKIVIDCANGAAYKVAPRVLADLGAEIVPIGCSPNGRNINAGCGSTEPKLLQLTVPGVRADVGIALDGDGDRVVMVDHLGRVVDGDQLLYLIARGRHAEGTLRGPVVGTVMTNLGLERAFERLGIEFQRAAVGDRHVLEMLRDSGGMLGGESSGHILCLDKATTGDGLVSALQVLAVMRAMGAKLAELVAQLQLYPQIMINVPVNAPVDVERNAAIQHAIAAAEIRFAGQGRVIVRASGTEAVVRVMVEAREATLAQTEAQVLAQVVKAEAGAE